MSFSKRRPLPEGFALKYIPIATFDLAIASVLVILNAVLLLALNLQLERQFLIATIRMIVQLTLIGLVLRTLFALVSPLWTGLAALAIILFAGREIMARQERRMRGFWSYGLGTGCMLLAASLVTVFALTTQVRPDPWYDPRYALPLLGMILGNTRLSAYPCEFFGFFVSHCFFKLLYCIPISLWPMF